MRKNQLLTRKDRGQAAILIAVVIMLAAVFMVALLIDGGMAMLSRRQAQAAADAGALAGANVICSRLSNTSVEGTAVSYATMNKATTATATQNGNEVTVTANITNTPFFASFLGKRSVTTTATATAGCYSPDRMDHVLPLAWTAFPGHDWSEYANDYNTFNTSNPSGLLAVFVDGGGHYWDTNWDSNYLARDTPASTCIGETAIDPDTKSPTPGEMTCALTGGIQVFGGNDRAWIGLDHSYWRVETQWINWIWGDSTGSWITISPPLYYGSAGADMLTYFVLWLMDETPLSRHWGSQYGHVWFLPTFDPSKSNSSTGQYYVDGFSAFYMTCVNWVGRGCPGTRAWLAANQQYADQYNGYSVEGYFLANYPVKLTGKGGRDSGLHYVSLSK